jgi:hypothetical protein
MKKFGEMSSEFGAIHDDVIIFAYVTIPFDRLRVTGHGESVEPCA